MRTHSYFMVFLFIYWSAGSACDDGGSGATLTQQSAVSECGGFTDPGHDLPVRDPSTYCDAEMLHWAYDSVSRRLAMVNTRVSLNCCGIHTMSVALTDGVYLVSERDEPEGDRCRCMCVFDYTLEASGISEGTIAMRLEREVTDSGEGAELIWEGNLDLTAGSGSVTVDASALELGCHEL